MANVVETINADWTAVDLAERFGSMPLSRIRYSSPPGAATEADVIAIHDHENRLFELVDGFLVEKTMGTYESFIAGLFVRWLGNFVAEHNLGIILPPDGMLRIAPDLVRIPDVSFISRDQLPDGKVPRAPIADLIPGLAVEVLSKGNTAQEMQEKLKDYFAAGVRLVWYVDHVKKQVRVYTAPDQERIVSATDDLDGGDVLPGFQLPVAQIFAD